MKSKPSQLESISLRRATLADADKVRYRVYSTPTDFVAVIAENALMAVRVSGIKKPHKIIRDLPTEGIAIEAKKMATVEDSKSYVAISTQPSSSTDKLIVKDYTPKPAPSKESMFKPINMADLQRGKMSAARIVPPELLNQIIEEHARNAVASQLEAVVAAPIAAAVQEAFSAIAAPEPQPAPVITPEAVPEPVDQPAVNSTNAEPVLSPEEVENLLNDQ